MDAGRSVAFAFCMPNDLSFRTFRAYRFANCPADWDTSSSICLLAGWFSGSTLLNALMWAFKLNLNIIVGKSIMFGSSFWTLMFRCYCSNGLARSSRPSLTNSLSVFGALREIILRLPGCGPDILWCSSAPLVLPAIVFSGIRNSQNL